MSTISSDAYSETLTPMHTQEVVQKIREADCDALVFFANESGELSPVERFDFASDFITGERPADVYSLLHSMNNAGGNKTATVDGNKILDVMVISKAVYEKENHSTPAVLLSAIEFTSGNMELFISRLVGIAGEYSDNEQIALPDEVFD